MLFESCIRKPDSVSAETEEGLVTLQRNSSDVWQTPGLEVQLELGRDALALRLIPGPNPVCRVAFSWKTALPAGVRLLNDHWERGYGDLEWKGLSAERIFPWYVIAFDGCRTSALGLAVQPTSFCHWTVTPRRVALICDVRSGVRGILCPGRPILMASILAAGGDDASPFEVSRRFCAAMSPTPRLPAAPVFGFNDWYYAYGKNSRETVLRDAARVAELCSALPHKPFCVIDDGWQSSGGPVGPWDHGNRLFGDMGDLAARVKDRGARPGLWMRPLLTREKVPETWTVGREPSGYRLDPSLPDVLDYVERTVARMVRDWGFELVKHDYSTFDLFGQWGSQMGRALTCEKTFPLRDRTRTSAEIVLDLYRAVRQGAGDALVIGCNTVGHLAAGMVEIQRTGNDTSGRYWAGTRKNGVNTLAFRMPQHKAFFACDADCVGLTPQVPWVFTRQWLDLLARSGTPLFVSASPDALGPEQLAALRDAFRAAARKPTPAEPLDWLDTALPRRWKFGNDIVEFDWHGDNPLA